MNQGVLLAILALGMTCSSEGRSETGLGSYGKVATLRRDTVVEVKIRAIIKAAQGMPVGSRLT